MEKLIVYTDGACSRNPGPGGYAFIIVKDNQELLKVSGASKETTNNRMELMAILRSLEHVTKNVYKHSVKIDLRKKIDVVIRSDSAYCINSISQGWVYSWKTNNWKTKSGHEVKNTDLWMKIVELISNERFNFVFEKVKGHAGNKYNELVDKLAKNAILRLNASHFQEKEIKK